MRVNSAFKGFFTNRFVVGPTTSLVMLAIFFIGSSFTKRFDREERAKQANLIIRHIGHRLLTQAGDLTSRVLPVTEIKEGTFLLQFENEFVFSHDSLLQLSQSLLPKTQFPSGYTVTVHDCLTGGIIYGFQINITSPDLLPCRGRHQPPGCYTIEFTFPDLYKNVEQEEAGIDPTEELVSFEVDPQEANPELEKSKSDKIDHQKVNSMPIVIGTEESKPVKVDHQKIDPTPMAIETEEPKSVKVDHQETNPIPMAIGVKELKSFKIDPQEAKSEEIKKATFDYPIVGLVCSGMLVVLGVTLLIRRVRKISAPAPVPNQGHSLIREIVPELPALGKFSFDVKGQRLLLDSEVISLTNKECKILELLHKNFSELIPRETLMQKVWINEGVITGRSLDMFVSKLRKKLSRDPELRITNVHGKGYKLEILALQIL